MAEKVTTMVMKVNLGCERCYKKIKRVLCSLPEIRDQTYDEKQNTVKIKVVSCCPDKILKKIRSKGGKSVEKIEIVPDEKKKEPEKKKEGGGEKAKDGTGEKKDGAAEKKGKEGEPKKEADKAGAKEKKEGGGDKPKDKEPAPVPVLGNPSIFPPVYPVHCYYDPYHQHQMQVSGPRPVPCYQYPGMPGYYGFRDSSRVNYCGGHYDSFSDENPSLCAIM